MPPNWKKTNHITKARSHKCSIFCQAADATFLPRLHLKSIPHRGKFELETKGARGPTSCTGPRCWVSCVLSISNFTREVSSPWKRLRLTLKQAHIQQLRLLKVGKVFFYLQHVIFHGFLLMCLVIFKDDVKDPPLSLQDSYPKSWLILFAGRPEEVLLYIGQLVKGPLLASEGTRSTPYEDVILYLLFKTKIWHKHTHTHIPTDRTVVGTPPCFNLLQSLRNCHHKAGRI